MAVGVVGGRILEVGGVDGSSPAAFEESGVDDGGIGGEGDAFGETVEEDSGDQGAFGVLTDLLLDEGGDEDGAGNGSGIKTAGGYVAGGFELGEGEAEAADHGGEDLEGWGVPCEVVGVGEEVAFERGWSRGIFGEVEGDEFGVREPRPVDSMAWAMSKRLKPSGMVRVRV